VRVRGRIGRTVLVPDPGAPFGVCAHPHGGWRAWDAVAYNSSGGEDRRIDGTEVAVLGGDGYRLPTEAEWEYACRAGSSTLYPFGDNASALGEFAWYTNNSENMTHPVGQKDPNAWGLHDMLGNVWEWCADCYEAKYYASSPPADPPGASGGAFRMIRGGSWSVHPGHCRSACRRGD